MDSRTHWKRTVTICAADNIFVFDLFKLKLKVKSGFLVLYLMEQHIHMYEALSIFISDFWVIEQHLIGMQLLAT